MTTSIKRLQKGFTLIELLTVIAIIGILAAIIIPTVGKVRDTAQKSVASSNLRQIGQAASIFATDNKDNLPKWTVITSSPTFGQVSTTPGTGESVDGFAAALSVGGGMNDATVWVVSNDKNGAVLTGASTVNTPTAPNRAFTTDFDKLSLGFGVVLGLNLSVDPSTTPVAFTRGILGETTGNWERTKGVYESEGGHIVFLGGNVQYFRSLGTSDTTGELIGSDGKREWVLTKTLKAGSTKRFVEELKGGGNGALVSPTGL